jgi:uncharacterized protein (DUF58 family)
MWRVTFRIFRVLASLQFWTERRFTRAGLIVLGFMILTAVLGVDTSVTVAYRIFTLTAALLAVAFVIAAFLHAPVSVEARLPKMLTAGEAFRLRFEVANPGARAMEGLTLRVEPSDPRPSFEQFRGRLKVPTYRGWARLLFSNRVALLQEAKVPEVRARSRAEVVVEGTALHRGRLSIASVAVARSDPLGLVRRLTQSNVAPGDICVLPKRYRLPHLTLPGARRYQPGGLPQGVSVGDSEEFLGLREYRPGDALQRIHWRSFARLGEPVVREFQDEFVARYALVLDTFVARGEEEAFEEAVAVAASFAWTLDTQECLLDLLFAGDELHAYTAGPGYLQPQRLLEVLAAVSARSDASFAAVAVAVYARRDQLSACIVVMARWDAERKAMLERLARGGIEVLALLVAATLPVDAPPTVRLLVPGRVQEGLALL